MIGSGGVGGALKPAPGRRSEHGEEDGQKGHRVDDGGQRRSAVPRTRPPSRLRAGSPKSVPKAVAHGGPDMDGPQRRGQRDGRGQERGGQDAPIQNQTALARLRQAGKRQGDGEHHEIPLAQQAQAEGPGKRKVAAEGGLFAQAHEGVPARRQEGCKHGGVGEVMVAVVAKYVDRRETEGGKRGQTWIANEGARGEIGEARDHGEQAIAQQADRQRVDVRQLAGGEQGPGKQRRGPKSIVEQPLLAKQRLLGIIETKRTADPQAHAEVDEKIGQDDEGDLPWSRPGGLRCHAGPELAVGDPL